MKSRWCFFRKVWIFYCLFEFITNHILVRKVKIWIFNRITRPKPFSLSFTVQIMEKFSINCRTPLVHCLYQSGNSPVACLRQYSREKGPREFFCCESTVRRLIKRFEETGSVQDASRSGRLRIFEENVDIIQISETEIQQTTLWERPSKSDLKSYLVCQNQ